MMPGLDVPTSEEIRDQLERMLAATRFRNAPNRADFLALVVRRALQRKKTHCRIIADQLFREKPSHYVQVTAGHLRESLKDYYTHEGSEDLVVIALPDPPRDKRIKLPQGEAYTPKFSYNANHAVGREFALAEFYRLRGTFDDTLRAIDHYLNVQALTRFHVGAMIGTAETYIERARWQEMWGLDYEETIYHAAQWLDVLHPFSSTLWRIHAVGGFMLTVFGKLDDARTAFNDALALDRPSTQDYSGYLYFLIATGNFVEALRLAKKHLDAHVTNLNAHIRYAEALAAADRMAESVTILEKAAEMDPGHSQVHLHLIQMYIKLQRPREALRHFEHACKLVDERTLWAVRTRCGGLVDAWPDDVRRQWSEPGSITPDRDPSPLPYISVRKE
jgi:tetratricopeptide (TPR) repeat protein